jgi:cold shock CspA family protein
MEGVVETLRGTFGFIRGQDGVSRFFIPRDVDSMAFDDMEVGMNVEFIHIDHPRGPRAISIVVKNGD